MALGWNEIKSRAITFSQNWINTQREEADAKPFLIDFFDVFGVSSRRVSTFEHKVKKSDERTGFIDLLWKGTILIEMKSRGKSLDKAYEQAKDYLTGLTDHELPKYILVCDFEIFRLYNIEDDSQIEFVLKDFIHNVQHFGFIAGYQKRVYKEEDPVNIQAAYLMGKLHDALKETGYEGHELEKFLVRLLFCLFSEDTTIFDKHSFQEYIETKTNPDGTDLGMHLAQFFHVLNTPHEKRPKTLDETLADFPYVNGNLFSETLNFAFFDSKMRKTLLECCYLDWSKISPAIFGSMFQSVMDTNQRRNLGAHYTSEKNILKVIKPLFLDKLWADFEKIKNNRNQLAEFHKKIAQLKFLDPACGCGNFLIITYRELRLLELEILKQTQKGQQVTNVASLMLCDVDRFYGIEYEEFPAQIAQVALWLIDHQMNLLISQEFGVYVVRLPLRKSAKIIHGNALQTDWNTIIENDTDKFDFILGNPPFIGKKEQGTQQKKDLSLITNSIKGAGVLDYVTGWYIKAAQYIQGTTIKVGFVSTNSISQGEQVGILWNELFNTYKIKIHFAHRTFSWSNEAKGNAAVHVVIIGFANFDTNEKYLYDYQDIKGESNVLKVSNINPYLVEGKDLVVLKKTDSICNAPKLIYGSMPIDEGILILSDEEKNEFIAKEPQAQPYIRQYMGGYEFINNVKRWCLWLVDIKPNELRKLPMTYERVKKLEHYRNQSSRANTVQLASTPHLFGEIRQPNSDYIFIPKVSSEHRKYIPMGINSKDIIVSGTALFMPNANVFDFGILTSTMHIAWIKQVCGRLESRFQYSTSIVYNNFPFPKEVSKKQMEKVETCAGKVLEVRLNYPESSLADLYDSLCMPPDLVKAHKDLDKAVDLCYRPQAFVSETNRIEYLFELYDVYTRGLFVEEKKKKVRKKKEE